MQKKKLRGLFLNTEKAICSIYESGKMCYDCLVQSEHYYLDYVEISDKAREISLGYDFYIFNYHWVQMGWFDTKFVRKLPGFKATIVLEMSQNSPFDCVSREDFDVHAFPRPLEIFLDPIVDYKESGVPIIGTFGLSFSDKGFDEVVKAVNQEFDAAVVRINVPHSSNVTAQDVIVFNEMIARLNIKKDVKVELSNHYFNKSELINWCAQNTLNVFLYNRRVGNGLSATTDQAIASGRPLAVSTNPTFRHIHSYLKPYPYLSLKDSINQAGSIVKKIQKDWSSKNFIRYFEMVLSENITQSVGSYNASKIKLPRKNYLLKVISRIFSKEGIILFTPPILLMLRKRFLKRSNISELRPFVHQAISSYSQYQEDLLIDLLLGKKTHGMYVDIGANDPLFNSNTLRFYLKGWRGINIEPGLHEYKKIAANRPFDINLNMAVSEELGKLTFYKVGNDSSLSTLDYSSAIKMADMYKLKLTSSTVEVMPISQILDLHLNNRHVDFMSVDAEGHDLAVLRSNDWNKYRPTLVMVESNVGSMEIIKFMEQHSYLYIFSNHVNALFIDKLSVDKSLLENISWN
jgi:FkbM family methyltransferase